MPSRLVAAVAVTALAFAAAFAQDKPATLGGFDRKDPKFDELIPKGAKIEVLAAGFKWTEGPVWVKDGGYLLFSDIPNNVAYQWSPKGGVKEFLKPSGYTGTAPFTGPEPGSNGLAIDKAGRLVLCQHGDRRIARLTKDRKFETLADRYMGKRLNSPNDLIYHPDGDLYFTDPPYGLPKNVDDPGKELDFQGVYRLKPTGELTLLTKELSRPNGIGFSPDAKTLYVANSDPARAVVMAFPVKPDGTLGKGRVFLDVTADVKAHPDKGLPDGLNVDHKGNVFATAVNGIYVYSSDGKLLGRIVTNDKTSNCEFGDDGSTLYLTVNDKLARVKTTTKGIGF
ncbi:MAG TPA: SMP-30/gluconolactonase/LRE family protein [Fimbriiglobus sp.]|nr:SMP-30/gluconolactonase/LRE family protein [Fimbriiglobus sp.]